MRAKEAAFLESGGLGAGCKESSMESECESDSCPEIFATTINDCQGQGIFTHAGGDGSF
jgi:hypothetical protein